MFLNLKQILKKDETELAFLDINNISRFIRLLLVDDLEFWDHYLKKIEQCCEGKQNQIASLAQQLTPKQCLNQFLHNFDQIKNFQLLLNDDKVLKELFDDLPEVKRGAIMDKISSQIDNLDSYLCQLH
mmetsp:Transcript_10651/g.17901  ORF Transcript_10651/g.17901 Transcript_10651/m.17901 type:complete len:128 (+) Transcript_10651:413-796(+)